MTALRWLVLHLRAKYLDAALAGMYRYPELFVLEPFHWQRSYCEIQRERCVVARKIEAMTR